MNNVDIEIVLNELLQVQKESNRVHAELNQSTRKIIEKYDSSEKKISEISMSLDQRITALERAVEKASAEIKLSISAKHMNVIHKKHFQLFPALNIKECYRVYAHIMKYFIVLMLLWKLLTLLREVFVKNHVI